MASIDTELVKKQHKVICWLIIIPSFIGGLFLPSSKTYATMIILPKIAQSDVIQKDVPEMYEAAKSLLLETVKKKVEK